MASLNIHLAVATRYMDLNSITNPNEFYKGTIEPDIKNKDISHYSDRSRNPGNLVDFYQKKTILCDFLKQNSLKSDYNKGVFLHLITDYLIYNDFINKDYLESVDYKTFTKNLCYSYNQVSDYLPTRYNFNEEEISILVGIIPEWSEEVRSGSEDSPKNIFEIYGLEKFIEKVASINLEQYKEKLLSAGKNVLPE